VFGVQGSGLVVQDSGSGLGIKGQGFEVQGLAEQSGPDSASFGSTDYPQVDMLGVWYRLVNIGA
jgi:hypothetical protein